MAASDLSVPRSRALVRLLALVITVLGLSWSVGPTAVSAHELELDNGLHHSIAPPALETLAAAGGRTTTDGTLLVLWGDGPGDSGRAHRQDAVLVTDRGERLQLNVDRSSLPPGGLLSLDHRRVSASGDLEPSASPTASAQVDGAQLQLSGQSTALATTVSGSQAWVTILCRFADTPSITPQPVSYFNGLLGGVKPGLDHYWRELSYGNVNISGSAVAGWYNLPKARSAYILRDSQNREVADLSALAADCSSVADADVYFPSFVGVNLVFNGDLDGYAWGGSNYLTLDGQSRAYRTTWLPPWGYNNQDVLAHEMGHGFGLPHSSGSYATPYDSQWDPMSAGGTCNPGDPTFGCVAVHTISYHKDRLGWIPADRKYTAVAGSDQLITIERLDELPTASGTFLMTRIPYGSGSTFYTVEARRLHGYDGGTGYATRVPADGVLLHQVDTARSDRLAQVVDPDGNGDPNDAGAVWGVGETFTDSANGIVVSVLSSTSSGYTLRIQNGAPRVAPATLSVSLAGAGSGSVTSAPGGINCGFDCTESLPGGTIVTLNAVAAAGSSFNGWSGACSGTAECVLTMTVDRSATATFSSIAPSASLSVSPSRVLTGGALTATYANAVPSGNDWVSLHLVGASDRKSSGKQPANGTTGLLSFTAPSKPGNYELRFFRNGQKIATSATLTVTVPRADLSIKVAQSTDPARLGSSLMYTITVTNNGPDPAANVRLTDRFTRNAIPVSASTSQGTCALSSGRLSCTLGSLAPQVSATVSLVISPTRVETSSSSAEASSSTVDPSSSNNRVTVSTVVVG